MAGLMGELMVGLMGCWMVDLTGDLAGGLMGELMAGLMGGFLGEGGSMAEGGSMGEGHSMDEGKEVNYEGGRLREEVAKWDVHFGANGLYSIKFVHGEVHLFRHRAICT